MSSSTGLQGSEATPVLPLLDLPAAALMKIHDALLDVDSYGFCVSKKDAAAFRVTSKSLNDAIILPSVLKLSFSIHRNNPRLDLAALLARPAASGASLRLRLTFPDEDSAQDNEDVTALELLISIPIEDYLFHTISVLDSLGDRLLSLDIPCISSITDALYVTSFYLPLLQHLVLHLGKHAYAEPNFSSNEEWEWQESQLTTLVLSVPPGSSPFKFCEQPTNNHLLDLSPYPALRHLVLRGPIVKQGSFESNGGQPFILPFHAKVTIHPGLSDHKPIGAHADSIQEI
mmetsp:Transcript_8073/g.21488  ORF Transcript_8073/g.21488 Transcript_8073/m.21488 type:complete len:287 (-) Transcript_8073:199-1059(-)